MRQVKVKALRKRYRLWLRVIAPKVPEGMRALSFRSWRRRVL